MSPEQQMVREFHQKFNAPVQEKPIMINEKDRMRRSRLICSESVEFLECADKGDFIGMVDALCDILVVTYGTAVELGVDLEPFFKEVHRSNMTKCQAKDSGGKIMKGPFYDPPDLGKILSDQLQDNVILQSKGE